LKQTTNLFFKTSNKLLLLLLLLLFIIGLPFIIAKTQTIKDTVKQYYYYY